MIRPHLSKPILLFALVLATARTAAAASADRNPPGEPDPVYVAKASVVMTTGERPIARAVSPCHPGSFEAVMSAKVPPNARPASRDYSACH